MVHETIRSMSIFEASALIAKQLGADPAEFLHYMQEDTIGGYHVNHALALWPMGSMWGVEGQTLYAIVRTFKPETIVEIGGWAGCSATHLAQAVKLNGKGHIYSVDSGVGGQQHGYLIPADMRQYIDLVNADGRVWLETQADNSIGFIFEDADHSSGLVAQLSAVSWRKLMDGGVLANHDAGHDFAYYPDGNKSPSVVGEEVVTGLNMAHIPFKRYLIDPSDCGLAISLKTGDYVAPSPSPSSLDSAVMASIAPSTLQDKTDYSAILAQMMDSPDMSPAEKQAWADALPKTQAPAPVPAREEMPTAQHIDGNTSTGYADTPPDAPPAAKPDLPVVPEELPAKKADETPKAKVESKKRGPRSK